MELQAKTLDRLLPLESGSHERVIAVRVHVPMRYFEIEVEFDDHTTSRLRNPAQLLGWSGSGNRRSYFLAAGDQLIRIRTNAGRRRQVRQIECWSEFTVCRALSAADPRVAEIGDQARELVSRDGSLLFVAADQHSEPRWKPFLHNVAPHAPTQPASMAI